MSSPEAARAGPLAGKRVLVTRAQHQASELADRLRKTGADPILIPTISIAEPHSFAALDAALARLGTFDWLIFTSANAVDSFHRRAQLHRITQLPRKIAVIGPGTGRAAQAAGLHVDLVPVQAVAEALVQELAPQASSKSFLLVRAAQARDVVPNALIEAGGRVTIAEAYRNKIPTSSITALRELFASPACCPDAVTFTSASTARNLAALLDEADVTLPPSLVLASIGPITSAAIRELGLTPTVEASESKIPALVSALVEYFVNR